MKPVFALFALAATAVAQTPKSPAALGSLDSKPTPDNPIGWRGDGSGRYPAANPPTTWERQASGDGYTTKGIVWMAPLPNIGVSCPIIVGDRIFLTTEVCDVVCLDKKTGRILWIRSNSEFEGLSEEERKTNPIFTEKLAPLAAELVPANAAVVEVLNGQLATAMTARTRQPDAAIKKKRELEKQILDLQLGIDKKGFERYWGQGVFGFSGPTPTSDGKHVCAFFTTGVRPATISTGNGNGLRAGKGGGSEHGNFRESVARWRRKLVVWANEMRGYDVESGKLLWTNPAKAFNTYWLDVPAAVRRRTRGVFSVGAFSRASATAR
jgi:outer membrane protein assembly factor BamB